ncbi:MAG: serine hydrolase [Burkholderiaceae bacterium]|nr:serine hydrolase [Burkholderiaceae bacterium]
MSRLSHAPRASVLAALVAASISAATPAGASTAVEKQAVLGAVARVEAASDLKLPGLWRHYLRLKGQIPADEVGDLQQPTGSAAGSLVAVLPEVLKFLAEVRAAAPTGLFDTLDAAQRAFAGAQLHLYAGGRSASPDAMIAVLLAVADGQAAMDQALDLAAQLDPPAIGLLLPAVQSAREAGRRNASMLIDLALKAGVSAGRIAPAQEALLRADALAAAGDYAGASRQDADGYRLAADTVVFSMDRFEQNLRDAFDDNTVGWAYAVSQGGQLARSGAKGFARTFANPLPALQSPTKKMHVASVSKTMTAILLQRRLHEMGLSENDEIGPWLPSDWVRNDAVNSITFRQLMKHTSGFGQNRMCTGSYESLREMVAQDVPAKGSFDYCNANFGLARVLLPRMLGFDPGSLPVDPAALASAIFLAYGELVYGPVGVPFSCDPQSWNPTVQYQFPDTGNPGYVEPSRALSCGGVGVQISATDLVRTMSALRYTELLLPADRFEAMKSSSLGFMDPAQYAGTTVGTFGINHLHGGDWDHNLAAGQGGLDACVVMFPINVEAAVTINSSRITAEVGGYPFGGSQCGVLAWAFENAWVAP